MGSDPFFIWKWTRLIDNPRAATWVRVKVGVERGCNLFEQLAVEFRFDRISRVLATGLAPPSAPLSIANAIDRMREIGAGVEYFRLAPEPPNIQILNAGTY